MRKLGTITVLLASMAAWLVAGAQAGATAPASGVAATHIVWAQCPNFDTNAPTGDLECGTLSVPLNYRQPSGEHINIAVSRLAASKPALRHGVLLLNPGGPGSEGLDMPLLMATLMPQSVLDRYDLIGFDPRGVGRSAPVSCGLTEAQGFDIAPPVEQQGSFRATVAFMRAAAQGCARNSGAHLPYITTANTARDMDLIRQALGERKISYWGESYGTYLGAVYATLFPGNSDRFVLDSSTDPFADWRETFRRFGIAEDSRFPDFVKFLTDSNSDLGTTNAEVRATYFQLFDKVNRNPIPMPDAGITLNGPWLRALTFSGLYSDSRFASIAALWQFIRDQPTASALRPLVQALRPGATAGFPNVPADNSGAATNAILCDDAAWSQSVGRYRRQLNADTAQHPIFGPVASNIWPCAFWPNRPVEPPIRITPRGPSNIMIVQNQRDPATPYAFALQMKGALGQRAKFVSVVQGGHGASYGADNDCAKETVSSYLVTGVLPALDFTCPASPATLLTAAQDQAAQILRERASD